jgi:hypothetical protein
MAQVVPLNWSGSFAGWGGPLSSGQSAFWVASGDWGKENRFYLFSAFCDGSVAAEIEVAHVSHFRSLQPDGSILDETHFQIQNNGSDQPVYYYFYIAWSDPIKV